LPRAVTLPMIRPMASAAETPLVGTRFSRAVALTGVVIGFVGILALGALALFNYNGWKRGRDRYPILAWLVAWLGIIAVAGISLTAVFFGPGRIDDFGGWGSVVMVVGSPIATFLTWRYDQAHANVPTLKLGKHDPAPARPDRGHA